MSWHSKIEAQIEQLIEGDDQCPGCLADTMRALLDVAVAADQWERIRWSGHVDEVGPAADRMAVVLDKLREVGDE